LGEAGADVGGGSGGGGTINGCTAETATAKATHSKAIDLKSDACVALVVNPTWSSVNISIEGQPGTTYPIPFTYTVCGGKGGSGELTTDYEKEVLLKGTNPGCDVYVQFEGSGAALKLMYYD
jgi:hypothetical protein